MAQLLNGNEIITPTKAELSACQEIEPKADGSSWKS